MKVKDNMKRTPKDFCKRIKIEERGSKERKKKTEGEKRERETETERESNRAREYRL